MDIRRRHHTPIAAFVLVLSVLLTSQTTHAQTGDQVKSLRTQLFTTDSYDKAVRPAADQTTTTSVSVSLILNGINDLVETSETLTTKGYLWVTWHDDYLMWTPSSYGNLQGIYCPQGDVWKPDITLRNSALQYASLGDASLNVDIQYDGTVSWYPFEIFQSACSIDMTNFPFDTQTCKLKFVAWSYEDDEVSLNIGTDNLNLDQFETSAEWNIVSVSTSKDVEFEKATLTFSIEMKRKPLYDLLTLVLPILLLTVLNLCVFILPSDGGEKSGYSVTVFLTLAVFLTIVEASLPENSNSVAIFSVYVIIQTVQSTIITIIAQILIRICTFDANETKIPKVLITISRLARFKPCRERCARQKMDQIEDIPHKNENVQSDMKVFEVKSTAPVSVKDADVAEDAQDSDDTYDVTWKEIANGMDILGLEIFSCLTILTTLICFLITGLA